MVLRKLISSFGRLRADLSGGTAIIFSLSLVPMAIGAGVALDYSRQNNMKSMLQSATDAASLRLVHAAKSLNATQLSTRARDYVNLALAGHQLDSLSVNATYANKLLTVSASASIPSTLTQMFGVQTLPVNAMASVPDLAMDVELVMVLDNTGSMNSQGKLTELKKAAKNLITKLELASASSGQSVKISIVPFDRNVNIGTSQAAVSWLDWSGFPGQTSTWSGCVADRDQPFDVKATIPTLDSGTWYPAVNCSLPPIMPLTNNWNALRTLADHMGGNSNTNVTIGIAWGLNMLTAGAPMSKAAIPSADLAKYMIVLTDGDNTQNRWTTDGTLIDQRTKLACDSARAASIQVFTVRVVNGNQSLLQYCASSPNMYYSITSATQLNSVFNTIAKIVTAKFYLAR